MALKLPGAVLDIIGTIEAAGFEAYAVGGCVRDLLRGVIPHDYDLASSCEPERIMSLFPKTVATGMAHGTVTVLHGGMAVEITRYRVDGEYSDSRRPDKVLPAARIEDDLARRDFTVNAMAYHPGKGLCDPYHGRPDLEDRLIRCVGDPARRFCEDALRILRAFRFCAQLDFSMDQATLKTALILSENLRKISVERIFSELMRMLTAPAPSRCGALFSSGALHWLGLCTQADLTVLERLPDSRELRFAALCLLCGADAAKVCAALKGDNRLRILSKRMQHLLTSPLPDSPKALKKILPVLAPRDLEQLLTGWGAIYPEQGERAEAALSMLREIVERSEAWNLRMLAVNGEDLQALGFQGRRIGAMLRELLEYVIENPGGNRREALLDYARDRLE